MKVGDRVRIARGEHEGQTGTIVDTKTRLDALDNALRSSPTREAIRAKLAVPDGCHAVEFALTGAIRVFSVGLLIPVDRGTPFHTDQDARRAAEEYFGSNKPWSGPITDSDTAAAESNFREHIPTTRKLALLDYLTELEVFANGSYEADSLLRSHIRANSPGAVLALVGSIRGLIESAGALTCSDPVCGRCRSLSDPQIEVPW